MNNNYCTWFLFNFLLLSTLLMGCVTIGANNKNAEMQEVKVESQGNEYVDQIEDVRISQFILGVGDTIDINVYRQDELNTSVKIGTSGRIMFPLIGDVEVAGKSVFKLRNELREELSKYFVNPQVIINVSAIHSQKVIVLGAVKKPGVFPLSSNISAVEVIAQAGGATPDAKLDNVILARGVKDEQKVVSLDLKKAFNGDFSQDRTLLGGDIVYVPNTTISNAGRFFSHITKILNPFAVTLPRGILYWEEVLGSRGGGRGGGGGGGGGGGSR